MEPLHIVVSIGHDAPAGVCGGGVAGMVGAGLRRLFLIWNRGYKTLCVCAVDIHEALHIAAEQKHMRRAGGYRRFEDVTDRALDGADVEQFGQPGIVSAAISGEVSGVYARLASGDWAVGGQPVSIVP